MKQKKIVSLCLAVVLTLTASLSMPVFGAETSIASEEDYFSYAISVAPGYLSLYESEIVDTDLFHISNGFSVFNRDDEKYRAFFVFKNDICVGLLNVSCLQEGKYASSFVYSEYPAVTTALLSDTGISLYTNSGTVWIINNGDVSYLSGVQNDLPGIIDGVVVSSSIELYEIEVNEVSHNTRRPSEYFLPVPIIENEQDPDNGYGLCWAACVASISKYFKAANITAMSVYKSMKNKYPGETITAKYVPDAFKHYGISMTCSESGMDFNEASAKIWAGKPIYVSLASYRNGAHAVVLCGYDHSNGNYYYNLMDPNEKNKDVSVLLDSPTSTNFVLTSADITFVEWRRSYY